MSDALQQQSRLKQLIAKGKEQGYLTYAEVNDHLPQDISEPDQVEDIIQMINDMGIQVFEQAPDADELILTEGDRSADEIAAAEAAAALAAVENEAGRTTDPVRMYMRTGSVVLPASFSTAASAAAASAAAISSAERSPSVNISSSASGACSNT